MDEGKPESLEHMFLSLRQGDYTLWRLAGEAGEASRIRAIPFKAPHIFIREASSGTLYWTTDKLNEWRRM